MLIKGIIAWAMVLWFYVPVCDARLRSPDNIAIRIALAEAVVCSDTKSLILERFITNASSKNILISRDWMLESREYAVIFDLKERFGRIASLQTRSDPISEETVGPHLVTLAAGATTRYATTIELDNDFFRKPGFYQMRMHYRGTARERNGSSHRVRISSNWLLFQVTECRPKQDP